MSHFVTSTFNIIQNIMFCDSHIKSFVDHSLKKIRNVIFGIYMHGISLHILGYDKFNFEVTGGQIEATH